MSESDFATFTDPSAPPPAEFWHGMTPGSDELSRILGRKADHFREVADKLQEVADDLEDLDGGEGADRIDLEALESAQVDVVRWRNTIGYVEGRIRRAIDDDDE